MKDSNDTDTYPDWIDSKTEITDEYSIAFIKFKLAIPFANFKSRDRLWITDDNNLITYICDPRDIGKNARKVQNLQIKIPLNNIVELSTIRKDDISIITIVTETEIIIERLTNLGKMLFFYFRDANKASELKNTICSRSNKNLLSSSQTSSNESVELNNHVPNQTKPNSDKNNGIHKNVLGIRTQSNSNPKRNSYTIVPESDDGDHLDDVTLVLPFGTQIPRRRAAIVPEYTRNKMPTTSKDDTATNPQPDYDDTVQDLLNYHSMKELKAIFDGTFIQFGMDRINEQKRSNEEQKRLHSDFWLKVEREKEEIEARLHTINKNFSEKVPMMTKKIAAFHNTLRAGLTTFPTVTKAINHALEMVDKANCTLADLEPNFIDD